MSDSEAAGDDLPYCVDRAKGGRAACKGCKQKCLSEELRIARLQPSPYGEGKKMKAWYHVNCLMAAFLKQRPTTARLRGRHEVTGWENLTQEDQEFIQTELKDMEKAYREKHGDKADLNNAVEPIKAKKEVAPLVEVPFKDFRKLCAQIAKEDAYLAKTAAVRAVLEVGGGNSRSVQELSLWCRLLLPGAVRRVYNLRSKQIVKLMSRLLGGDRDAMLLDLQQGDVAETVCRAHNESSTCPPKKSSNLTCRQVDEFLNKLSQLTKEDEQVLHFKSIIPQCTANDLKMIIRLIKCDLRINAGPKHILEGVHPDAYSAFQTCRDIDTVLERVLGGASSSSTSKQKPSGSVSAELSLMLPVLPMLAEACTSVEMAMSKCPNGMFSEIKYDGERVQVHKQGSDFKYFSRALKPVMAHKIERFREFIPQAFPHGKDLVLDAEVLMVDTRTGKPLPFGTLGVHKRDKFSHAEVCLVVFDCIHYNGVSLLDRPLHERRQVLLDNMKEITNHVVFSEMNLIRKQNDLVKMILKVLEQGLEGLVLKDVQGVYTPGKRRWLKVKRDYLLGGSMADTADLVVLGAWYGTGKKGGMLSVFLMGCWDEISKTWCTVTKVHTGLDDVTLASLQEPLMELLEAHHPGDPPPSWLKVKPNMVPDMLAKNPEKQPVWEITGTEFTRANIHTADGISVRFPRITRRRDDKTWREATNLSELKVLFQNSRDNPNLTGLRKLVLEEQGSQEEIEEEKTTKINEEDFGSKLSPVKKRTKKEDEKEKATSKVAKRKPKDLYDMFQAKKKTVKEEEEIEEGGAKKLEKERFKLDENELSGGKKRTVKVEKEIDEESMRKLAREKRESDSSQVRKRPLKDDDEIESKNMKLDFKKWNHPEFCKVPLCPLPIPFSGYRMSFCSPNLDVDLKVLVRHWIAYGGVFMQNVEHATHLVHVNHSKRSSLCVHASNDCRHVKLSWLTHCLKQKQIVDTKCYTILY